MVFWRYAGGVWACLFSASGSTSKIDFSHDLTKITRTSSEDAEDRNHNNESFDTWSSRTQPETEDVLLVT
jgi:hypothetical protein